VGDSAIRLVVTLERAPRGDNLPKDCPQTEVLLEAKAAALHLHPERY
jgi:hypothetical protein